MTRDRFAKFVDEIDRVMAEKKAKEPPVSVERDDRGRVVLKVRGQGVALSRESALRLAKAIEKATGER
jgi:hypothetical protein